MKTLPHIVRLFLFCALTASIGRAQIYVVGDLSQDHEASPGDVYEGSIIVKNDGSEPAEAKVYQTDYHFTCDGKTLYGQPGSSPRSNSRWIVFKPQRLTVPPKGAVPVSYTVHAPDDSTRTALVGSYWSMLMIEQIAKGSPESTLPQKENQMGIQQTIRYGLQIATHIGNSGTKKVQFLDAKLIAGVDGKRILQIDIENTGERWIRPEVHVELFGTNGLSQGKFVGTRYRIYPGTSVRESIELPGVPPGEYKALIVVDAGGDDTFGAQYTLKF